MPSTVTPSVSSRSSVAPTSRIDFTPAQTTTIPVRASVSRSADSSQVSRAPRCTPPSPPVANTRMPAREARWAVDATVVAPSPPRATSGARTPAPPLPTARRREPRRPRARSASAQRKGSGPQRPEHIPDRTRRAARLAALAQAGVRGGVRVQQVVRPDLDPGDRAHAPPVPPYQRGLPVEVGGQPGTEPGAAFGQPDPRVAPAAAAPPAPAQLGAQPLDPGRSRRAAFDVRVVVMGPDEGWGCREAKRVQPRQDLRRQRRERRHQAVVRPVAVGQRRAGQANRMAVRLRDRARGAHHLGHVGVDHARTRVVGVAGRARALLGPELVVGLVHELQHELPAVLRVAPDEPVDPAPVVAVRCELPDRDPVLHRLQAGDGGASEAAILASPVVRHALRPVGPARELPGGEDHAEAGCPRLRDLGVDRRDVAEAAPGPALGKVVGRLAEGRERHPRRGQRLRLVPADPDAHPGRSGLENEVEVAVRGEVLGVAAVVCRPHRDALGEAGRLWFLAAAAAVPAQPPARSDQSRGEGGTPRELAARDRLHRPDQASRSTRTEKPSARAASRISWFESGPRVWSTSLMAVSRRWMSMPSRRCSTSTTFPPWSATTRSSPASAPGRSGTTVESIMRRPAAVSPSRMHSDSSEASTLPPDSTAQTSPEPGASTRPCISAATATAPAPSTTSFERSSSSTIAWATSSSETVTTSST